MSCLVLISSCDQFGSVGCNNELRTGNTKIGVWPTCRIYVGLISSIRCEADVEKEKVEADGRNRFCKSHDQ